MNTVREVSCLLLFFTVAGLCAARPWTATTKHAVPGDRTTIAAEDLRRVARAGVAPDGASPLAARDGCAGPCYIVKPIKDERPLVAGGDPPIMVDFCGRRPC